MSDHLRVKVSEIFSSCFEVGIDEVGSIEYQSVPAWDSIGHMIMISELESEFSVSIEMDDVITISNLETCLSKLAKYVSS
jgi:acyl carrier protein